MTFSDYFAATDGVEAILQRFGYGYRIEPLILPRYDGEVAFVADLQEDLLKIIQNVTLLAEISRREFLIAPIIAELVLHFGIRVRSEFTLRISDELQGNIDYLLTGAHNLVVIEAKQGDLQRGFQQLAAELVAVAEWKNPLHHSDIPQQGADVLYGAVTLGDAWRFAHLDRVGKIVTLDVGLLRVPSDLDILVRALLAMLNGDS